MAEITYGHDTTENGLASKLREYRKTHFPCGRRHVPRKYNDALLNVLLFQDRKHSESGIVSQFEMRNGGANALSHCFHTYALLVGKEYEYLVHGVVLVVREEIQLTSAGQRINSVSRVSKTQ